ncbi:SIR2 family NAD-dependent protein deacylase [Vibrio barjaei]|uniref:SIR2 family NAD-dependent protein deacylase n=1 Tax=Vibrio barjaei TaxID=1676683 RepID=UPI002284E837|nr:Sir2 family NAD-dependent protein deacetylase [Vibrio barjaei]MCY9870481.1 hypothetical protein [Vibrio barjaei]
MRYSYKDTLDELKNTLEGITSVIIYTGAGMGVDSGLEVFRGNQGLWEKYPEARNLNMSFQDLANPYHLEKYPDLVVPFYRDRLETYLDTEPHKGHQTLLELAESLEDGYFCCTSNVDGHLQKAGFSPEKIHEIHGQISYWQCTVFRCAESSAAPLFTIPRQSESKDHPRCPTCNALARPNLLMFYDLGWLDNEFAKQSRRKNEFLNHRLEHNKGKTAVIELGAGHAIPSIRMEAELTAEDFKTKLIRINPEDMQPCEERNEGIINLQCSALEGIKLIKQCFDEANQ